MDRPSAAPAAQAAVFDDLALELEALAEQGLRRTRSVFDGRQGPRVVIDGRELVSFASNDYLGLAADARVAESVRSAVAACGVGAGASHLLHGHHALHEALEASLAEFVGAPRALAFSCGYMANLGVVTALCGRGDEIFADRLNHASLNDAMVLSRASFRRYPHNDLAALERLLQASRARRKLVATDAVFSMDGDLAPVPGLIRLCERHAACLLLDDAHGLGVVGPHGAGTAAHFGVRSPRLVLIGTLGKAAGVAGAFVAGAQVLIDYLVNRARTYIYTTASPPLLAAALRTSLEIVRTEDWRRARRASHARLFADALGSHAGLLMPSSTAIQPLLLGTPARALAVSRRLRERGYLVPAVRPPTVPRGTSRLRISLSAAHEEADVRGLGAALAEVLG